MDNIKKSRAPLFLVKLYDRLRLLPAFLSSKKLRAEHEFTNPFFIIGCGRSGNTLLRSILMAGGDVVIPPESYVWPRAIRRYSAYSFLPWDIISSMIISEFEAYRAFNTWEINLFEAHQSVRKLPRSKQSLSYIMYHIYRRFAIQKGLEGARWGDKTPINTIYADKLLKIFPAAQFIYLERDPRDVVCSYVKAGLYDEYESPAKFWKACKEMSLNLENRLPKQQLLRVSYEEMVSRPEEVISNVCSFLGINYSADMLEYWKNTENLGDVNYRAHHANIKSPISTNSIGKWKSEMSADDLTTIEKIINSNTRVFEF